MADIDELIAYHEAGHVVAARLFGVDIAHVTMNPTDDSSFAAVRIHYALWLARDAELPVLLKALEADCKASLAGPYAEMRFQPDTARMQELRAAENWGSDMKTAKARVASAVMLKTGQCASLSETQDATADAAECLRLFAQFCDETEKLVAENWPAIKRVAECLQRRRILKQVDVDALMAD